MANEKNSFVFYRSFYDAIKSIPQEQQLALYNAIMEYTFENKILDTDDGVIQGMFALIKPNIDSTNAKYWANIENGKKGGRPKKEIEKKPNQNPNETQPKPNQNPTKTQKNLDEDVDEDVDEDKKENIKKKRFIAPNLDEINQYISEKKLKVDGQKFYEYFTEGGWKDSKGNSVKNWKQKLLTWNKYADNNVKKQSYEQRQYDDLSFLYANKK